MNHDEHSRPSTRRGRFGMPAGIGLTLALVLGVATFTSVVASQGRVWPLWKEMRLKANTKLVISGHVDLMATPKGDTTHLETRIRGKLFGITIARTWTRSVVDSRTSLPSDYMAFSTKRGRHYIFGEDGYKVRFLDPPPGGEVPVEDWTVTDVERHAYPRTPDGSGFEPVYDYYGVVLKLRSMDLDEIGDEETVYIATSDGPVPYALRVVESRDVVRKFRELPTKEKRSIAVTELMLKIIPLDPEEEQGFLGMEGETQVWIEKRTKTLVQISGRAPRVGWIDIMLTQLERAGRDSG